MKNWMKILLGAVVVSHLVACAKSGGGDSVPDNKVKIDATAQMDAEQLALAAEQLMNPYSFMLADKVLDMALAKDPSNVRATFYKAILKPRNG